MTNDELRALLTECRDKLLSVRYGLDQGVDPRLAFITGYAIAVLGEGLSAERDNRPMKLGTDIEIE